MVFAAIAMLPTWDQTYMARMKVKKMTAQRFYLEFSSDDLDEKSVHTLLQTVGCKKLTARFVDSPAAEASVQPLQVPGTFAQPNEQQRTQFAADIGQALKRLPYLAIATENADGELPYMVQTTVRLNKGVRALHEEVKADVVAILNEGVIRGRKTAQVVRDVEGGFEVLFAIMDDEGFFVTARIEITGSHGESVV